MKTKIPEGVIGDLIRLGKADDGENKDALLVLLAPHGAVDRFARSDWEGVTEPLSESDHACLARGLVSAETLLNWSGGSVAAAIWVFALFQRKFPASSDALADWMLKSSCNPWVPFGSDRGTARSMEELRAYRALRSRRRNQAEMETLRLSEVAKARRTVRQRLSELQRKVSGAASAGRNDLLKQLLALPVRDRLLHIALDQVSGLQFYPAELVSPVPMDLDPAGQWAFEQIKDKAAVFRSGPWRKWFVSNRGATIAPGLP